MGMNLAFGSFRDGENPCDPLVLSGSVTYFGGQPASILADGSITLTVTANLKYIGVLHNSSFEDTKIGNAAVIPGPAKITLINGSNAEDPTVGVTTVEGAPYDTNLTYAAGDLLYISATGFWQNTSAAALNTNGLGVTPKAIVISPATATNGNMDIYLLSSF